MMLENEGIYLKEKCKSTSAEIAVENKLDYTVSERIFDHSELFYFLENLPCGIIILKKGKCIYANKQLLFLMNSRSKEECFKKMNSLSNKRENKNFLTMSSLVIPTNRPERISTPMRNKMKGERKSMDINYQTNLEPPHINLEQIEDDSPLRARSMPHIFTSTEKEYESFTEFLGELDYLTQNEAVQTEFVYRENGNELNLPSVQHVQTNDQGEDQIFELVGKITGVKGNQHVLITVRDTTYWRTMEHIKVANNTKSKILGSLSHELRNPLHCIYIYIYIYRYINFSYGM